MSRESGRRFHFMREIASGGFGAVYLTKVVHADGFSRLAAVKLLHRRWSENEEIARRMRDEARLLGWLRHRNIVDVVDLTSIDGRAAVVMEYLEAVDLKFIIGQMSIRSERLPASAVMDVMSSVASALDAAYNRPPYPGERPLHVIHRDIKPSNIMIDETGLVKVLDFGVARADFDARESQTKELQFGSVDYMPPERLFFEPETPASDVYSLGATMYEVLTQEKLGKAKGRPERHARFLADRFSYMRAAIGLGGQDATEVERLLTRCLSFDHQNRPAAAEVMKLARKVGRSLPGPSLADWAEEYCGELIRLQEEQPRSPSPLTDSILSEDSKAFGVSQGKVEVSMDEAIQEEPSEPEDAPHVEIEDDDDSDIVEPVPEKPPWMFEETREDSPSEAHLLRNEALDQDRYGDEAPAESAPAPFGHGEPPFLDEPGGWAPPESPQAEEPPELPEPSEPPDTPSPPELRNNPTIIPELASLPPLPEPASTSPFAEDIDPDLMATRVGPSPVFSSSEEQDDSTLLRPSDTPEDEEPAPSEDAPASPLSATPVAPVVDSIPGFEPSLDDWDDVPTRIEAEPVKEPKSGAAKVSGSVVSVVSALSPPPPVVPSTPLPGQETALMPVVPPPPDLQEGDDSTQLMPSDAPPPPPPLEPTLPPRPVDGPPAFSGDEPIVLQTEAPQKKSKLPMLAGGCVAFVLFVGCCGGLGWGWFSGIIPALIPGEGSDVEVQLPEGNEATVAPEGGDPVDPPTEPVEAPPAEMGPGGIQFISLAEGTRKLKVSCSGGKSDAKGDTVVYSAGPDPKCTVTAYMEDRSRLTAIVTDVDEGTWRCFEGGEKRCEK